MLDIIEYNNGDKFDDYENSSHNRKQREVYCYDVNSEFLVCNVII